ncbi:hypothetical protein GCM10009608_78410 [Pseudonocardia alaniniphila]
MARATRNRTVSTLCIDGAGLLGSCDTTADQIPGAPRAAYVREPTRVDVFPGASTRLARLRVSVWPKEPQDIHKGPQVARCLARCAARDTAVKVASRSTVNRVKTVLTCVTSWHGHTTLPAARVCRMGGPRSRKRGFDGRSGLRGSGDSRIRDAGCDPEGVGVAVNSASYIVGGLVALGLLVYLFIALLRPERF